MTTPAARAEINLHEWLAGVDRRFASAVDPAETGYPPSATLAERTCRECGCTDARACKGGCWWVEADLCNRCDKGDAA